ncbi:MAG: hypothetical protein KBT02_11535 [Treponema sp.]|nr:hypothetical protein [Candidatus Treponema caballi]
MGENITAFGRQVIFVNPSYLVKTIIIQKLLEMEYEVYYVDSPRSVKAILRKFPHSMCLIDVDSSMAAEEFLNFIASIENDPEFSDVLISVLTRRMASLQKLFNEKLKISAGYINTSSNKDALLQELKSLFDCYEVKGRRQFVRVSLPPGSGAQFYCKVQGIPTHFPLRDISSCGFACDAKGYPEAAFTVNSLIPGELQLGTTILPCSVVLFTIKRFDTTLILVMLFAQTNAWSNKKIIQSFVAEKMQKTIDEIRASAPADEMDYSQDVDAKKKKDGDSSADEQPPADSGQ